MKHAAIPVMTLFAAILVHPSAFAAETTWSRDVRPIVEKRCLGCHGADSPEHDEFMKDREGYIKKSVGMRMDTYSHLITYVGWPYTGALIRRLDDGTTREDRKPGNMYQHLGDTEQERAANLAIFRSWVGSWNVKRWKEISKDELNAIKVRY